VDSIGPSRQAVAPIVPRVPTTEACAAVYGWRRSLGLDVGPSSSSQPNRCHLPVQAAICSGSGSRGIAEFDFVGSRNARAHDSSLMSEKQRAGGRCFWR